MSLLERVSSMSKMKFLSTAADKNDIFINIHFNHKFSSSNPIKSLVTETVQSKKVLALYFVPAFLYCLYNNLSFVNLSYFDPTSYYLLLQFRVVLTAVLFQVSQMKVKLKKE